MLVLTLRVMLDVDTDADEVVALQAATNYLGTAGAFEMSLSIFDASRAPCHVRGAVQPADRHTWESTALSRYLGTYLGRYVVSRGVYLVCVLEVPESGFTSLSIHFLCTRRRSDSVFLTPFFAPPKPGRYFYAACWFYNKNGDPNGLRPAVKYQLPTTNYQQPTANGQRPTANGIAIFVMQGVIGSPRAHEVSIERSHCNCRLHAPTAPWHWRMLQLSTLGPREAVLRLLRLLDLTHKRLLPPGPPGYWPQWHRHQR